MAWRNGKRDDHTPPDLSLALVNYPDLMALQIPERARHLPWLPEGGNVMVFGPRGIGKTFLQLALGVSLIERQGSAQVEGSSPRRRAVLRRGNAA